ncbi:H-NS histone family protein [Yoonia sp. F2084L]|uniref:H-NS histone family protein n=1 Tax=Yoonia sp. F2084L TaxID=2926419 RepID=UPI001FF12CBC|nr:H-NS histone family protein [Yoonia sp. F2084L]MCK0095135.1 H-NS histone family protein [Yoonia sp. F2084L]
MKPDLKSMTRKELEKLKANVEKALVKLAEKDKKAALAAAEKAAAAHGFSLAEITADAPVRKTRKAKTGPKTASAPKYKNPANADQTWTGKGRQPDWFKKAIAGGTSPDAMEI